MKIVVSGSTGLVGTALGPVLVSRGHEVVPLVRRAPAAGERALAWDPERGTIDGVGLEGTDVVIHLAGENVFGRWSPAKKRSEEHTSELQSLRTISYAVFCLKKK